MEYGLKLIDADSHLTAAVDLWTSRAPAKYKDRVPQVAVDDSDGVAYWWADGTRLGKDSSVAFVHKNGTRSRTTRPTSWAGPRRTSTWRAPTPRPGAADGRDGHLRPDRLPEHHGFAAPALIQKLAGAAFRGEARRSQAGRDPQEHAGQRREAVQDRGLSPAARPDAPVRTPCDYGHGRHTPTGCPYRVTVELASPAVVVVRTVPVGPGAEFGEWFVAEDVTELPSGLSIQGEQQRDTGWVRASDEDVDLYVDRVSDEVLACRERGRHLFPTIRQAGIYFTGVDDDGLFIRRLTCDCCRLAVKVEKWEGVRQRGKTRFRRVGSTLEYRTGQDGQSYLAPSGRGHMTARQIGDSVASKALSGQSLAALRKAAKRDGAQVGAGGSGPSDGAERSGREVG